MTNFKLLRWKKRFELTKGKKDTPPSSSSSCGDNELVDDVNDDDSEDECSFSLLSTHS